MYKGCLALHQSTPGLIHSGTETGNLALKSSFAQIQCLVGWKDASSMTRQLWLPLSGWQDFSPEKLKTML